MPQLKANRRRPAILRKPAIAVVVALVLACIGLAACGGSSSSSTATTTANAAASGSAGTATGPGGPATGPGGTATAPSGTATGPSGQGFGRFKALRECLQRNGITLTKRTPGQRPPGGFLGGAGGPQLPAGVTRAQYEAAVKKCGGAAFAGAGSRIKSPVVEQALTKFAACMRENGVNVPAPNTSGSGPVFNTKGIDTTSPQFHAAETKCSADLQGTFRRGGPTGGPPAGSGPSTG